MYNVYLDIETTGLRPFYGDEVTCVCVKVVDGDNVTRFSKVGVPEPQILNETALFLEKHAKGILITKNGKMFDVPFLLTRAVMLGDKASYDKLSQLVSMIHIDLHEITKKWVSLDDMARMYGLEPKTGNGKQAIQMFHEGRYKELARYCGNDVELTQKCFETFNNLGKKQ